MDFKYYQVTFYQSGRFCTAENFQTLALARAEAREFISESFDNLKGHGFKKVGNLINDNQLTVESPGLGFECGAYIKPIYYSRILGVHAVSWEQHKNK